MSCVWLGYGKKLDACAQMARCQGVSGKPEDTTCPHLGDSCKCGFVRSKIAQANEVSG